jgi:hypothetical protein
MVPARGLAVTLLLAAGAVADVAVPETGPVFRGSVEIREASGDALLGGTARPLREILVVERDDGKLVWTGSFERRVAGYRRIVHEGRRARLLEMLKEAHKAKDPELARRLLDLARAEGLSGKEEDVQRRRLENLEKRPGKRDEARSAELRRAAAALDAELPDLLLARAKADATGDALLLLREALRAKPDHAPALALLEDRAPKPHPFPDDRAWLDWNVTFERRGFALAPEDHPELKKARHYWRPDLLGLASAEILVLTPMRDMDGLREIVLRAHLACAALRDLFRTDAPLARPPGPILVYLETNEQNFREQLKRKVTNPLPPYFQFEHARWELDDDVTRVLWRDAKKDRNDLLYGSVFEICRHWLWSRNPRTSLAQTNARDPDIAGYWAEVGLPGLLAEARYDLDKGTIDLATGAEASRAYVRAHVRDLLPWSPFCLYGRHDLHIMNKGDVKRGEIRASALFGMQSTVVCQALLCADGGRRRAALADFVVHRYRGEQPKLAPTVAFGMTPEELGTAAVAWAAK